MGKIKRIGLMLLVVWIFLECNLTSLEGLKEEASIRILETIYIFLFAVGAGDKSPH